MIHLKLSRKHINRQKMSWIASGLEGTDTHWIMSRVYYFSDKKSERAKDLHLVKKLAALLRAKSPRPGRCL